MRVMVYSHIRLFGQSLADCLSTHKEISEVQVCHQGGSLVDDVLRFTPDVILIDMKCERAAEEAHCVREGFPEACLLALAIPETANEVISCADAGFAGYIPYTASLDELCAIMSDAHEGGFVCNPEIAGSLFREVQRRRPQLKDTEACESLTRRESEVLGLVAKGLCNKEIARELVLSASTVKNHLHTIFAKLHVSGRIQALARLRNEPWLARPSHTHHRKMGAARSG